MTKRLEIAVLLWGTLCGFALVTRPVFAQSCDDDEAMVESYRKDLTDLVGTTRKESLNEFEKAFHQRVFLTKLTLSSGLVKELKDCLDKAAQDSSATKEQVAAAKADKERYARLQDMLDKDQKNLKAAAAPKDAKTVIAKFDFADK